MRHTRRVVSELLATTYRPSWLNPTAFTQRLNLVAASVISSGRAGSAMSHSLDSPVAVPATRYRPFGLMSKGSRVPQTDLDS